MSTISPAPSNNTSVPEYPAFTPRVPKPQNKFLNALSEAWYNIAGYARLAGALWLILFLASACVGLWSRLPGNAVPEPLNSVALFIGAATGIALATGLGLLALATPFVMGYFIAMFIKDRGNKTDFDPSKVTTMAKSLTDLGVADARNIIKSNPLQAEAYERVSFKARKLARAQGMSDEEATHHGHNLGLLMYPGTAELEREVPLMRVLEDRGVTNANDALASISEPQYVAFTVPVTAEEIAASKMSVKAASGDIMEMVELQDKIRSEGYKPTIAERNKLKGTDAYWGSMFGSIPIFMFAIVSIMGTIIAVTSAIGVMHNGGLDLMGAIIWGAVGIAISIGTAFWVSLFSTGG